ncbi:MAG: RNA polymerase factor sigma-54 [Thermoanaerobaculia bacterium]
MGLEQKLSLRLSQRLVMTPTLQQAIKLLQMTRLELQDVVNQEIVGNPVLEEQDPEERANADEDPSTAESHEIDLADAAAIAEAGGGAEQTDGIDGMIDAPSAADRIAEGLAENAAENFADNGEPPRDGTGQDPEPVVDPSTDPANEVYEQIDLEAYFGDYMDGTATAPRMTEEAEEFSLENRAETAPGLDAHLTEQLGVSEATPAIREACGFLIGNVDPDGYLRMTLDEVVEGAPCTPEIGERAIALLQSFDPVGVGARNLAECLLIQARAANVATPLLIDIVTNRINDLGTKPPALLARQMSVPMDELQKAIEWIRKLDPKPGRRYDSSRTIYVEPDVAVIKLGDDYVVLFNDDGLPRLKVSSLYRRMLQAKDGVLDGEGKSYLREKMRAAQWLMKSLDQRKRTIVRVAESIVKKQRDFLDYGVAHLRPLVLRDVAEDIGMHESTVSRVVSNKWMATPRGLLPMKFFFHSAIASSGGEDISSLAVKGKIRALIEAEDPAHPLSDARLSELLAREGIRIARRTVAKYREELRISSSSIRRVETTGVPEDATAERDDEDSDAGASIEAGKFNGRPQENE